MSRYAAAIADLERRRDLILGALKALYALDALGDDGAGTVALRTPAPQAPQVRSLTTPKPGPKPGTHHGPKVSADGWKAARKSWDALVSAEAIGREIGCSGARVNQHAREHGWPKRDYAVVARKARLDSLAKQNKPPAPSPPASTTPPRVAKW